MPSSNRTHSIANRVRKANELIDQATALQTGERKCKGTKKNGEPCGKFAIKGGTVCPTHGGSAPQVKAKAAKRLLAMVEPSIIRLEALVHQTEHMPTALGAIRTVLERAGTNPIGALKDASADKNAKPIIQIGIAVGGISPGAITVKELNSGRDENADEGEVLEDEDEDE